MSMPFSIKHANHFKHIPSLLQMYKKNPVQFMETMSKVDPDQVHEIINLLKDLLEKSEAQETALENELQQASDNLGQASNDLVNAQDNVAAAVAARETAESNLGTSKETREEKQREHDAATQVRDDQVDGLNEENKVIDQVIEMLRTLLPSGPDEPANAWSEYSRDVACEGNGAGRDTACDVSNGGGVECCQESALARGFKYVVWWEDMCYATETCDDPYNLVDTVNYHYDGSAFVEKKHNFLSVKSSPAGHTARRKLLNLESILGQNPKEFVAEMSKADPSAIQNIIDLLEALKATNEAAVSDILQKFDDTEQALGVASAQVVADEDALAIAQSDEASAELALTEAETAESSAQNAKTEAQDVYNGEIDTLNNEQQVLRDVIGLLENLVN